MITEVIQPECKQPSEEHYYEGMKWRGITLGKYDAQALNNYDRDISKAAAAEAKSWLIQNKAEFIGLMLGIETVKVG